VTWDVDDEQVELLGIDELTPGWGLLFGGERDRAEAGRDDR
jgi:hypothetical protein